MKLIPALACAALLTFPLDAQREGGERPPEGSGQERGRQDRPRRGRGGFGINAEVLETLLKKYDKNDDGKIDRKEYPRGDKGFANLDKDKNGAIEKADLEARRQRGNRRGGNRGERGQRGERPAPAKIPAIGEVAPDFDLPLVDKKDKDGKEVTVKLSSFAGKKPVALIFGSYT